jgi:predicted AAA+ superfamily ATPase
LEILNDTLITFHLPSYEAKLRVRERKHPKLYWLDPGVVRTARGDSGKVAEEERGALFESFVAQTLRSFQHCQSAWEEMFYWAPSEARGIEVDFLLKSGRDFVAIEVKSGTRLRPEWLKGLEAIAELPRLKRRILVYLGDRNMRTASGIDVVTLGTFLSELKANSLFHFDRRKP